MAAAAALEQPSRTRKIAAAIFVALVVIAIAKFIDYRMQPPVRRTHAPAAAQP